MKIVHLDKESEALCPTKSLENSTDMKYDDPLSGTEESSNPILTENAEFIQSELPNQDTKNSSQKQESNQVY